MLKEIKKIVGIIGLVSCNLFIGCEDVIIASSEPQENIIFNFGLPQDENGYYHLTIDRTRWQTLHRVSGNVFTSDSIPIEFFWMEWSSDLYWYLGDTLGYVVDQHLSDNGVYVNVDTSYIIGFNGQEVPTTNKISYSNSIGEINNMIAPVKSMIGDTMSLTAMWHNSEQTFGIILD